MGWVCAFAALAETDELGELEEPVLIGAEKEMVRAGRADGSFVLGTLGHGQRGELIAHIGVAALDFEGSSGLRVDQVDESDIG